MIQAKEEWFLAELGLNPNQDVVGMHGSTIKLADLMVKYGEYVRPDFKTPMEKTRQDIKDYVKSINTSDNTIYQENELLILSCFSKAQEFIESNEPFVTLRDSPAPCCDRSEEEIISSNSKRFVSQVTKINCASCGEDFKVSNRQKLTFKYEKLNDTIGKIWIKCPNCKEVYDLGVCEHN